MDIVALLLAMAAGVFGAAIGALLSFVVVGVFIFVGVAILAAGGGMGFLGSVAFGIYGPHVAGFASGVAAAAWAANKGKLEGGRDIVTPLMGLDNPGVLLIGAIFGGIGYLLNWVFNLIGIPWTDTIALTVVISAIIARLAFGKTGIFGKVPAGQVRFARPAVGSEWLPWQTDTEQLVLIGLGAGGMSAFITQAVSPENGGQFIGFALSAVSLVLLQFGQKAPVTHHITLTAGVATAASGSLVVGVLFGVLAAFLGEFFSRLFLIYGDTHIDPPACTIATLTSLSLVLESSAIYPSLLGFLEWVLLAVVLVVALGLSAARRRPVRAAGD